MVCKTYKVQLIEIYIINLLKCKWSAYNSLWGYALKLSNFYFKIHLKYVQNMSLFHSKLKNIILLQMFFNKYIISDFLKPWAILGYYRLFYPKLF
jgi:hypothetical protein